MAPQTCRPGRDPGEKMHASEATQRTAEPHGCRGHHHGPALRDTSGPRLLLTLVLNLIIPTAQIVGGLLANSVALISDAVHNFSDFTALLISYIALRIGRRGATVFNTFGYRRAEIMAALINVMLLAGAAGVILYHAVQRFWHPQSVDGMMVMALAGVGVVGNGLSAWLLHRDAAHSLNVRGAFLHMVGDLLTSVAVLINGLLLLFYPWYWLDPFLSILIVMFILKNGWGLLRESTAVLMDATPGHLDLEQVRRFLNGLPGVLGVHYLHAWQVSSASTAFSCHVVVPDQPVSRTERLADQIKHELWHRFRIDHPVLQFETAACGQGTLLCEMACNGALSAEGQTAQAASASAGDALPDSPNGKASRHALLGLRLFMGAVFLYASYNKILHPQAFAEAIYNYRILPDGAVNLAALVLPWLELVLGVCLVAGVWLPGAAVTGTGLLAIFSGALVFNLARGLDVHCGCFSTEATEGPADLWTVTRDAALLAASVLLTVLVFGDRRSRLDRRVQTMPPKTDTATQGDE